MPGGSMMIVLVLGGNRVRERLKPKVIFQMEEVDMDDLIEVYVPPCHKYGGKIIPLFGVYHVLKQVVLYQERSGINTI